MKRVIVLIISILLITGCQNKIDNNFYKIGYSSNIYSESDINRLKEILDVNNVSNIDTFIKLVNDFNKEKDKGCGITKNFIKTNKLFYNEAKCTKRYEKNHDISDGNCRITAYLLLENILKIEKEIKDYGSYLMFDMDVLDNNKMYKDLNKAKFITLFNEMKVTDSNIKEIYPNKWKEFGLSIDSDNTTLITVVMHDPDSNVLFIGHTGVLIKQNNNYIFIEKIAFEMPYQISVFKTKDDLKEMLFSRKEYFGDKEEGPFIYENERLLYSYK